MNLTKSQFLCLIVGAWFVIIMLLLSGCSIQRHVEKTETKTLDQQNGLSDIKTHVDDKTITRIKETGNGDVVVPGTKLQSESIGSETKVIVDGDTLLASFDKKTNVIKALYKGSQKKISVPIDRETTIESNVNTDQTSKIDTSSVHKSDVTIKKKDSKTSYVLFGIGGLVLLVGLGYVAYRYVKSRII